MATLSYTAMASLDGFIEDVSGSFDFAFPDPEVHAFVNDLQASVGTDLYGRRMYETMAGWETMGTEPTDGPDLEREFAEVWRAMDKVVYSTTLTEVWTARTTLERTFEADAVRRLVESSDREVSISGPSLAGHAFRAGLVDEVHLFLFPVVVGGGKPALPPGVRTDLELADQHRFASGVVHLHHRVVS